ncbi:c-type cytochrome [Variovorax terrae]|uniref:Cytochrome c4 n=1 Tax=Variovorax terrae TaxID=2923278 RepID=A0A9X1VRP2_9BURK|nr:c-type cytochrome [Variovorax terrae]MCJ0762088.1 cytochrome c4 [Variovorax terrae]
MNKLLTTMFAFAVASVTAVYAPSSLAQEIKGDAKAGEKKIAMCIGCHGIVGYQASFPEVYKVPKISGQGAKYIVAALNAYKAGERKHPTMRGIADSLSDQDMADVAAYYSANGVVEGAAALPAKPAREPSAQQAELLKKGNCVSCHGDNFAKPIDPAYPKIAGQHADYLFVALKAYKTENNAQVGRSNGVMGGIAKQFSNAELKALAGYVGALEGDLKVVPEARFR